MKFDNSKLAGRIPMESLRWLSAHVAIRALVSFALCTCMAAQEHPEHHLRYRVVEIATFGGPNSLFNGGTRAITNDGRVVGAADTAALDLNAPDNCFEGPACMVQHAWEWREGKLIDLGVLAHGYSSYTNAIT